MTKTCATCQQDKQITEYGIRKNPQGREYPYKDCRACINAARRADTDRYQRLLERQRDARRAQRAAQRAELSITAEITALIRATTSRGSTPPAPLPTREELRAWYEAGCRI